LSFSVERCSGSGGATSTTSEAACFEASPARAIAPIQSAPRRVVESSVHASSGSHSCSGGEIDG